MGTHANSLGFVFEKSIYPQARVKKQRYAAQQEALRDMAEHADEVEVHEPSSAEGGKGRWKICLKIKNKHARKFLRAVDD